MKTHPRTEGLPWLCTTGDVAAVIGWSPSTVRRYLMPKPEWERAVASDESIRFRRIPSIEMESNSSTHARIPREWVEAFVEHVRLRGLADTNEMH